MKSGRRKTLKRKTLRRKTLRRKTMKHNYKGGAAANGGNTTLQLAMKSYNNASPQDKAEWLNIIEEIKRRRSLPAPTSAKQNMIDYVKRMAPLTNQQKREHINAMRYPY